MKIFKFITTIAMAALMSACMDGDWDEPGFAEAPYGNNAISEENVISIRELISDKTLVDVFSSTDQITQIDRDIKIRGRIVGNDIGSNIYKQVILQDETAAIVVAVNQNGLNGFLAEGQEILVDMKGLYLGGYRMQPEIGAPYGTSIGRMQKDIWQEHFKIVGDINPEAIQPIEFSTTLNQNENCGKLVVLKNVSFKDADGTAVFAPEDGSVALTANCANRQLNEFGTNVVIRTSTYAKFAAMKLPYDEVNKKPLKCNITGIATRYNSTWQILIRKTSDIEVIE